MLQLIAGARPGGETTITDSGRPAATPPYPSLAVVIFAMAILCLAQIVSTLDRGVLNLLIDPVRRDLGASDLQMSLLQGLAFAIFYVTVGVPVSALADRVSRVRLLASAVALWSLATVWGGLSHSFAEMFASRLLVGLGEALLGPCAVTMMADMFPLSRRSKPMSVYLLAGAVSPGLSSMLTAAVLGAAQGGTFAGSPLLAHLSEWRLTFVLTGAMGLMVAALLLMVREPTRRGVSAADKSAGGFAAAGRHFLRHWRILAPFYLGIGAFAMATLSVPAWGATMLIRTFHMPAAAVGAQLGWINIVAALLGAALAWVLVSAAVRRWGVAGKLKIAPLLPLAALPCAFAVFSPWPGLAIALMAAVVLVMPMFGAALLSATSDLAPARARGIYVSLYAFAVTMIGGTIGPLLVALATEHVFKRPDAVGYSIMIVVGPALLLSALLLRMSYLALRREVALGGEMAAALAAHEAA